MYCSSCGVDSVEGLRFCKRCGVSLTSTSEPFQPKTNSSALIFVLLIFIAAVFLTGLTMPLLLTKELSSRGFSNADMMTMLIIEFGVTLAVVFMLVRLLSRLIGNNQQPELPARGIELPRKEFTPQIAALEEPRGSVTEHTTRSFEKLHENLKHAGMRQID